ncbi:hypothetical protein L208DRAFT_1526299 [Tricholoma matsutake]|nr:hypothetical protein L208DRAFT_1526299 [Tricholoma matsutake 945]
MKKCFFVRGRCYSLLPALSVGSIIHAKIVKGSFTARHFYDFIDGLLDHMQPFPLPTDSVPNDMGSVDAVERLQIHTSIK